MVHHQGEYFTFHPAGEEYGIGLLKVKEVIRMLSFPKVPRTTSLIKRVIYLRGKVIPVRKKSEARLHRAE